MVSINTFIMQLKKSFPSNNYFLSVFSHKDTSILWCFYLVKHYFYHHETVLSGSVVMVTCSYNTIMFAAFKIRCHNLTVRVNMHQWH